MTPTAFSPGPLTSSGYSSNGLPAVADRSVATRSLAATRDLESSTSPAILIGMLDIAGCWCPSNSHSSPVAAIGDLCDLELLGAALEATITGGRRDAQL